MKKYRCFINFEKEEDWLNKMAQEGWRFTHRTLWGTYCFAKSNPQNINYRIDYRVFNKKADFVEYTQLFADGGWQHVYGTKYSGCQYFVPKSAKAEDDIFSDNASKAGRYRRLSEMWASMVGVYAVLFVASYINGGIDLSAIFSPKEFYYTPGLWEKTGISFWWSFLFETPFALGRGFAAAGGFIWFYLGIILYLTIRTSIEGKKHKF